MKTNACLRRVRLPLLQVVWHRLTVTCKGSENGGQLIQHDCIKLVHAAEHVITHQQLTVTCQQAISDTPQPPHKRPCRLRHLLVSHTTALPSPSIQAHTKPRCRKNSPTLQSPRRRPNRQPSNNQHHQARLSSTTSSQRYRRKLCSPAPTRSLRPTAKSENSQISIQLARSSDALMTGSWLRVGQRHSKSTPEALWRLAPKRCCSKSCSRSTKRRYAGSGRSWQLRKKRMQS